MSLTVADLRALLRRVQRAVQQNYGIALAEHYANELGETDSSPRGLLKACRAALADTAEGTQPPALLDVEVDVDDVVPVEPAPVPGNDRPTWVPSALAEDVPDEPGESPAEEGDTASPPSKKRRRRPGK